LCAAGHHGAPSTEYLLHAGMISKRTQNFSLRLMALIIGLLWAIALGWQLWPPLHIHSSGRWLHSTHKSACC